MECGCGRKWCFWDAVCAYLAHNVNDSLLYDLHAYASTKHFNRSDVGSKRPLGIYKEIHRKKESYGEEWESDRAILIKEMRDKDNEWAEDHEMRDNDLTAKSCDRSRLGCWLSRLRWYSRNRTRKKNMYESLHSQYCAGWIVRGFIFRVLSRCHASLVRGKKGRHTQRRCCKRGVSCKR